MCGRSARHRLPGATTVLTPTEAALTEVPEHLLSRSRDRRAALGLGGGAAPAPESSAAVEPAAAAAPAAAASAAPAPSAAAVPAAPKPPEPLPPYVEASLRRKKIPLWAFPVLAFLPVWGWLYVQTLSPAPSTEPGQLEAGAEVYSQCSACHGGAGGGGAGRQLSDGEVLKTFPTIEGQLEFVARGSEGTGPKDTPYGDPNREGGAHATLSYNGAPMPAFGGTLTQQELLEVVRHERETLSGEEIDPAQIGPEGELLHPNGTPYLNEAGELVDENGELMFDEEWGLVTPPDYSGAGGGEVAAGG